MMILICLVRKLTSNMWNDKKIDCVCGIKVPLKRTGCKCKQCKGTWKGKCEYCKRSWKVSFKSKERCK